MNWSTLEYTAFLRCNMDCIPSFDGDTTLCRREKPLSILPSMCVYHSVQGAETSELWQADLYLLRRFDVSPQQGDLNGQVSNENSPVSKLRCRRWRCFTSRYSFRDDDPFYWTHK